VLNILLIVIGMIAWIVDEIKDNKTYLFELKDTAVTSMNTIDE
jgi:hypothetical protein